MRILFVAGILISLSAVALAQDQQLGARTKAMGGSYTAFEDDPVSIWLNPAGIAVQPDQVSIAYHTYTAYPVNQERAGSEIVTESEPETIMVDPALLPSFLGVVTQFGDAESPMALGICYARPYHLKYAMDYFLDPGQKSFTPRANVEQSLSRFRIAFAKDFRFRKVGERGFLPHLSVGIGVDLSYERWEFTQTADLFDILSFTTEDSDTSIGFGGGLGILMCLYDNAENFKVNVGMAYQSKVKYDFDINPDILPAFNMPQQLNAGATFYITEGMPLRLTADFQWIEWSETAEDPIISGQPEFEDVINLSMGLEYRFTLSERAFLYPRVGVRLYDAPWADADDLPATGLFKLVMDTDDEAFALFTYGVGFQWMNEDGKLRSVDLAGDAGGDSVNFAIGYSMEF